MTKAILLIRIRSGSPIDLVRKYGPERKNIFMTKCDIGGASGDVMVTKVD